MSFFPGKSAQSRPLGLVTLQPGGTSRVRKPREKFFFFSPGRTENDPRSSGLPTGTCRGVGEGCGTGMAFWGRWGKRGSLEHCRGAEPRDEAEGRHGTQKALLRFREKKNLQISSCTPELDRTTAPHPWHMPIPELGGCRLLYRHQKSCGLSHHPPPTLLSIHHL